MENEPQETSTKATDDIPPTSAKNEASRTDESTAKSESASSWNWRTVVTLVIAACSLALGFYNLYLGIRADRRADAQDARATKIEQASVRPALFFVIKYNYENGQGFQLILENKGLGTATITDIKYFVGEKDYSPRRIDVDWRGIVSDINPSPIVMELKSQSLPDEYMILSGTEELLLSVVFTGGESIEQRRAANDSFELALRPSLQIIVEYTDMYDTAMKPLPLLKNFPVNPANLESLDELISF